MPTIIDPKTPVPFGTLRERATSINVASTYPKHMSITHDEADIIVRKAFSRVLQCNSNVIEFKLPYDQGLVNCIRALRTQDYGIAANIKWVRFDWKAGYIKVKLKGSM